MVFYPTLWQRPFELFRGWPLERFLTSKKNKEGTFQNLWKKVGFCENYYYVRINVLTKNHSFSPNLMYVPACNISYINGKSEKCDVVPSLRILRIFSMNWKNHECYNWHFLAVKIFCVLVKKPYCASIREWIMASSSIMPATYKTRAQSGWERPPVL